MMYKSNNRGKDAFLKVGRKREGIMNNTERLYMYELEIKKKAGIILDFYFEKIKLKIDSNCYYTIDFVVITSDYKIEFIEIKGGYIMDDAMVKFKAVSALFPYFDFYMYQYKNKTFNLIRSSLCDEV